MVAELAAGTVVDTVVGTAGQIDSESHHQSRKISMMPYSYWLLFFMFSYRADGLGARAPMNLQGQRYVV